MFYFILFIQNCLAQGLHNILNIRKPSSGKTIVFLKCLHVTKTININVIHNHIYSNACWLRHVWNLSRRIMGISDIGQLFNEEKYWTIIVVLKFPFLKLDFSIYLFIRMSWFKQIHRESFHLFAFALTYSSF